MWFDPAVVATFTHLVLGEPLSEAGSAFWARALDATWRAAPSPTDGDPYVHCSRPGETAPALVLGSRTGRAPLLRHGSAARGALTGDQSAPP